MIEGLNHGCFFVAVALLQLKGHFGTFRDVLVPDITLVTPNAHPAALNSNPAKVFTRH
jgi:uracil-DNA glycosylase